MPRTFPSTSNSRPQTPRLTVYLPRPIRPLSRWTLAARWQGTCHAACCLFSSFLTYTSPVQLLYRQASNGTQTYSTPTSVLDTNTTPDPLRNHPRYVKIAELGLGSSAFVLLAEDKQRMKDVAIKFINRGSNRFERPSVSLVPILHNHRITVSCGQKLWLAEPILLRYLDNIKLCSMLSRMAVAPCFHHLHPNSNIDSQKNMAI